MNKKKQHTQREKKLNKVENWSAYSDPINQFSQAHTSVMAGVCYITLDNQNVFYFY